MLNSPLTVIVAGANGQLGRAITEGCWNASPAEQTGASVRDQERARGLRDRGMRVRRGDFIDPASLARAFDGA